MAGNEGVGVIDNPKEYTLRGKLQNNPKAKVWKRSEVNNYGNEAIHY